MKEKIKYIIIFIIGIIISTVISVYAATVITAGEVSYTSNSNTTVQTGLDNLYTKANTTAYNLTAIKTLYSYSGSIFITTSASVNNTVLNAAFGGTWTKVTTDAYLKIVSSGAGSAGGTSSNHKIPVSSMPSHSHTLPLKGVGSTTLSRQYNAGWTDNAIGEMNSQMFTNYAGGGNAYYPYYIGIYVWKRS